MRSVQIAAAQRLIISRGAGDVLSSAIAEDTHDSIATRITGQLNISLLPRLIIVTVITLNPGLSVCYETSAISVTTRARRPSGAYPPTGTPVI